jgi:hypothetical protein
MIISDVTGTEGNSGVSAFVFDVTLSSEPPAGSEIRVDYSTQDITATAGSDYQAVAGTLLFTANTENIQRITVPVNGDTTFEPNESFFVKLSNLRVTGEVTVIIVKLDGIGVIFNDDPSPSGSPTPTPTPTPGVRVEGDVVDANGNGANGDGAVLANDVSVIRGVLLGNLPPIPAGPQFQAADVNLDANNGCGNGQIDVGDVTVIRRYNLGELVLKPACGPTGPTATRDGDDERSEGTEETASGLSSTALIRAGGDITAARGSVLTIPVEVETQSQDRASAVSFTVGWDIKALRLAEARLGPDASVDASLGANTRQIGDGKLGLLIDSSTGFEAGRRHLINLKLVVDHRTAPGVYDLTISDEVTPRQIAGPGGNLFAATYSAGRITITDAAPDISVLGRVLTPDGRGLRNAQVRIVDSAGIVRATMTSSFGQYRFDNVRPGSSLVISVVSRRYRFAPKVFAADAIAAIDLVGSE